MAVMNKKQLVEQLAQLHPQVSKQDIARLVESMIAIIKGCVCSGDKFTISNFGIFSRKTYAARVAYNPHKDEKVTIPETRRVIFTPGKEFKEMVAKQCDANGDQSD